MAEFPSFFWKSFQTQGTLTQSTALLSRRQREKFEANHAIKNKRQGGQQKSVGREDDSSVLLFPVTWLMSVKGCESKNWPKFLWFRAFFFQSGLCRLWITERIIYQSVYAINIQQDRTECACTQHWLAINWSTWRAQLLTQLHGKRFFNSQMLKPQNLKECLHASSLLWSQGISKI